MKRLYIILITISTAFGFITDYSHAQNKRTYNYKNFTGIETESSFSINVVQSDEYSIEVEGAEGDLTALQVIKKGKTVVFFYEKPGYKPIDEVIIKIKTPELYSLNLSKSSQCNMIMSIESDDFTARLSDGSSLIGVLNCEDANFISSGGSSVTLNGNAETLTVNESDKSTLNLKDFVVQDVNAELSQNSSLSITAHGTISANQKDGSGIIYYGDPVIDNTDFSGGSTIARGK